MKTTLSILMCGTILSGVMLTACGCASNNSNREFTSEDFRKNPSPELYSYAASKEQFENDNALVIDQNMRLLQDDIAAFFMLDQPQRTTPLAIP